MRRNVCSFIFTLSTWHANTNTKSPRQSHIHWYKTPHGLKQ